MVSQARPMPKPPNLLRESGLPLAYPVASDTARLSSPDPEGHDIAVRTAVRSFTVMQKEAIVQRTGAPVAWRLASDEGPYLQGHDFAPAPLAVLTTGLCADVLGSVERAMAAAGMRIDPLRVALDARFTIEGSLPRGTMVGGAEAPEITVFVADGDRDAATGAVLTGVMSSATAGLSGPSLSGSFSLTSLGMPMPVGRVTQLDEPAPAGDERPPSFPRPLGGTEPPIVTKTFDVGDHTPDAGVSLQPEQRRTVHLRAEAIRDDGGIVVVDTSIHRPHGSTFRFLSDEPAGLGGEGRAPDAASYISAGIGFCLMTQLGRYARIMRRSLGDYHIEQDTRFSLGDATHDPPVSARVEAPRTHVYLAPDDFGFAADALDMSEQTCFVHGLCRSKLRPRVKVMRAR